MEIEARLDKLGLELPPAVKVPAGVVQAWLRVHGMVNCSSDFTQQPAVINGFSDLILHLYGQQRGAHARSAVGMAALPFNMPVEIEALVAID